MSNPNQPLVEPLTERECEILATLVDGLTNQEIANKHHLALKTVKWYNTQIYSKLGVSSRHQAIEQAQALNLLEQPHDPLKVPNNLPAELTTFVGRDTELNEISQLLSNPDIRLVTILGPGGMGKTRLGLRIGQQQLRHFEDGVFLVKLAAVTRPDDIFTAIADVFHLNQYGDAQDTLEESMAYYLRSKTLLLILDNFEHLLEGAGAISDLLQQAPNLKILVTSRERLNLNGEQVYVLSGLEIPPENHREPGETDAVQLFVQRVQRIQADYVLSESDWPHVARICRLVGGMPLGVELAAGWMDLLSAERIADEISNCLDILETDMRDVPERHRSIRASLNQTWERLSVQEQQILMRISVFRGGFTQKAAEAVTDANLRVLRRLTDKALIYHTSQDRYDIHDLVHKFSEEKLRESGSYDEAIDRYMVYFANLLGMNKTVIDDLDKAVVLQFKPERKNVVAAWDHILAAQRFDLLDKMCGGTMHLFTIDGKLFEHLDMINRAFDTVAAVVDEQPQWQLLYATLMADVACANLFIVSHDVARQRMQDAIDLLEPFGPTEALCDAYMALAEQWSEYFPINHEYALELMRHALHIAEQIDEPGLQIRALHYLIASYIETGDDQSAWQHMARMEQLQAAYRPANKRSPWTLSIMGRLLAHDKRYDEAAACFQEFLDQISIYNWIYGSSNLHRMLGTVYLNQGDLRRAKEQAASAIIIHRDHGTDWQMLGCLWGHFVRWFLLEIEEDVYAVEILSFVHHHPVATRHYAYQTMHVLNQLRDKLDPETYQAAFERGKEMKMAQVVEDALAYLAAE